MNGTTRSANTSSRLFGVAASAIAFLICLGAASCANSVTPASQSDSDSEAVARDVSALAIGYSSGDSASSVTGDLTLPVVGEFGCTITWVSSNADIITNSGTVSRPGFGSGDASVTLTATISSGDESDTAEFPVTVIEGAQTDAQAVAEDKAALAIGYESGESAAAVIGNLTLPTSGSSGSTVAWSSSNVGVISEDGAVTRPDYATGDVEITLTATISKGSESDTRLFTVTVCRELFFGSNPNWSFQTVIASGTEGSFTMGQDDAHIGGDGVSDDEDAHSVSLTRPYAVNTFEVTNTQYASVMNEALDRGWVTATTVTVQNVAGDQQELLDLDLSAAGISCRINFDGTDLSVDSGYEDHPVTGVSWYGAVAFAYFLNEFDGLAQTYDLADWSMDAGASGYRLPTEAEWEYAAAGGGSATETTYAGSNTLDDVAWYDTNSDADTHPVGGKSPNEIGVYDMNGNVWEWVHDWYGAGYYATSPATDPEGPDEISDRVLRGGAWNDGFAFVRVTDRGYAVPTAAYTTRGFRLVVATAP